MDYENNVKRVIPMIMLVFISSATMISVINIISPQLTVDFGISPTTVSLLSMTVMLMMGVASVAYSTLSDYLSIRRLMLFGVWGQLWDFWQREGVFTCCWQRPP